jgi:hypothetical protein
LHAPRLAFKVERGAGQGIWPDQADRSNDGIAISLLEKTLINHFATCLW